MSAQDKPRAPRLFVVGPYAELAEKWAAWVRASPNGSDSDTPAVYAAARLLERDYLAALEAATCAFATLNCWQRSRPFTLRALLENRTRARDNVDDLARHLIGAEYYKHCGRAACIVAHSYPGPLSLESALIRLGLQQHIHPDVRSWRRAGGRFFAITRIGYEVRWP
jgi:hypothetical protein